MLTLSLQQDTLAICRLAPDAVIPEWALAGGFYSITRTADELSIVCKQALIPDEVQSEIGWRCLKTHGPLPFSMTGVVSRLTAPLAEAGISLFVISTFDTDYLLVNQDALESAIAALRRAGISIPRDQ